MKAFQYSTKNVGDTLTKPILEHFLNEEINLTHKNDTGKIVGVGSIIYAIRKGDIVWGTGLIEDKKVNIPPCKILAVRGKLTENRIGKQIGIYGDPAILLPLIYNPEVEKIHEVGIVEHYIDKGLFKGGHKIDVEQNWKTFVDEIKKCKKIKSSSLHGLIIAEAYGIPAEHIKLSNNVIGGDFKFKDYLSASDRTSFNQPLSPTKLKELQEGLIRALCYFKK